MSHTLPKTEQYSLADQMRRASRSICANLAEGFAKHHSSNAEFKRFIAMAIGSSNEMIVWLDFCIDLKYTDEKVALPLKQEYTEIGKMLYKLSQNWISRK